MILPMRLRGSRSYLKQSDNSRSQDHSEVLPGEKVSTHTTDSVSQEEFPHINYSTPIQHTINQELNGGMDMSRTSLSSLMTSMDGSSMSCSKLQIITPTEFRSKEDSENSQQAVSSPPTVSQMIGISSNSIMEVHPSKEESMSPILDWRQKY